MENYILVKFKNDGIDVGTVKLDSVHKYTDFQWMYWIYGFVISEIRSFFANYPEVVDSHLTEVMGRTVQCVYSSAELIKETHGLPLHPGKGWSKKDGRYERIDANEMEIEYHHELDPSPNDDDLEIISKRFGRPCFGLVLKSNQYCKVDNLHGESGCIETDKNPSRDWRVVSYRSGFKLSTYTSGKLMFVFASGVRSTGELGTPLQGVIRILEVDITPGDSTVLTKAAGWDRMISFEKPTRDVKDLPIPVPKP